MRYAKGLILLLSGIAFSTKVLADSDEGSGEAEIRRTTDGVPHVRTSGWRGLVYGYGLAVRFSNTGNEVFPR